MSDIVLAGDLYLARQPFPEVSAAVRSILGRSRHAVVNLEAPVTDTAERIAKTGPHLTMPPDAMERVAEIGFSVVALANNHILDAGLTGLAATMRSAEEHGLRTVGASVDTPVGPGRLRLPLADGMLTVLDYCENEWSVRPDGRGANGWDLVKALRDVREARADGDRVLVLLHGGNEYFPLPRPRLRDELRFLAESGADAIAMHHTHVTGAYEIWAGVPIFYGLGNFQFTLTSPYSGWYEGLLLELDFSADGPVGFEAHPIRQTRTFEVALAEPDERTAALRQLEGYRIQVGSDDALRARWAEFTRGTADLVAQATAPTSRIRPRQLRRLVELVSARRLKSDAAAHMALLNYIRCESHKDALEASLSARVPEPPEPIQGSS